MIMFGLILHVVTIMSLRFEVRGEMTAGLVFDFLSERLDHLAVETYRLKSELRSSVAAINDRIDNIIQSSHSPLHSDTYSNERINNILTDYEERLTAFQRAVSDQINVMNTTIETSFEHMGRNLEENVGNNNKSVHQLIRNSEAKFQDVIHEFETLMNNASIEHETTRSDMIEIQKTAKDIEDDLNGGWSTWSSWSKCSRTYGVGIRSQSRDCNNPVPSHNGHCCTGDAMRVDTCNKQYVRTLWTESLTLTAVIG